MKKMLGCFNCFLVMLLVLLVTSHVCAVNLEPTKTVKNFLQLVVVQDKNAALRCTEGSAECKKLVDDFMPRLTGWSVNDPPTFETIRILEEPKVQLEKIVSNKATVTADCIFAYMGGHLASKEITKEKYVFSLVNSNGAWIIISGRTVSSTRMGYRDMNTLPIWDYAEQKCPPLYKANLATLLAGLNRRNNNRPNEHKNRLEERKRKEHLADELRPQRYTLKTKAKYIPLMQGWPKVKVEKMLGRVSEPEQDMWNYEFFYPNAGNNVGGALDVYFIDNKVYKVIAHSSSIGSTFSASTLDPKLSKVKFGHIVGDPTYVNYHTHNSAIIIATGCTLYYSSSDKIKPEDTEVSISDLRSNIFIYYEVPSDWQGIDLSNGTELIN